jgi:hypothetical protein
MARKSIKKYGARRRRGGDDGPSYSSIQTKDYAENIGEKSGYLPTTVRKTKGGRTRKLRGGYYGATGAIAPGAMEWGRSSEMGGFVANSTRAGNNAVLGAGRKRRGTKKSRKTRRRKMRGGGKYGGVAAAFGGDGVAGMANYTGVTSRDNVGVPFYGKFNDHGAGPSSGFGSFVKAV